MNYYMYDHDNGDVCEVEEFQLVGDDWVENANWIPISEVLASDVTDADIVSAMETMQQSDLRLGDGFRLNGTWIPTADARAAWSRELKRRFSK